MGKVIICNPYTEFFCRLLLVPVLNRVRRKLSAHDVKYQLGIPNIPGDGPDMVQGNTQGDNAGNWNFVIGRLKAGHPAAGTGNPDGSPGIGTNGKGNHSGSDRGG